jgi:hypothetical protein
MATALDRNDKGAWIVTAMGRRFSLLDPKPADVDLLDLAIALAQQCRWSGHTREHYSVGEHSLRVADFVKHALAHRGRREAVVPELQALLHDAAEAYIVDVPRPIKPLLQGYREIEERVHAAICARFGIPVELPDVVHEGDGVLLITEARDLFDTHPPESTFPAQFHRALPHKIHPQKIANVQLLFVERLHKLLDERESLGV